jgi:hypothetical protein
MEIKYISWSKLLIPEIGQKETNIADSYKDQQQPSLQQFGIYPDHALW